MNDFATQQNVIMELLSEEVKKVFFGDNTTVATTDIAEARLLSFSLLGGKILDAQKEKGIDDECEDGPKIGDLLNNPQSSLRFIRVENTNESKNVDVAVSRTDYVLTPPGTSASILPITFVVRSKQADNYSQLRQRCVQIDGTGNLLSGTWDGSLSTGKCNADGDAALPTP